MKLWVWVAARERVAELAAKSPKFSAIDRVIGRNGLKVAPALPLLCLHALACARKWAVKYRMLHFAC